MHKRTLLASIIVSGLALSATPALAATAPDVVRQSRDRLAGTKLSPDIQAALQRDLGLSAAEVKAQGVKQAKAIQLDEDLQASLGDAFAGSAYDSKTGKLTVMVSDAAQADEAVAAGAEVKVVKNSKARLDSIKNSLDAAAGRQSFSATDRKPNGKRQDTVDGMTSWYVDETDNTVHVTVAKGKQEAAQADLAKYGDAVQIEESDLQPTSTANFMDGGDDIHSSTAGCSAGFNVRNRLTGQGYIITAGHCFAAGTSVYGQGNVYFGPVLERWFPTWDDAIIRNDNAGYWIQGAWVDTNPSNGGIIFTSNYTNAPVGTYMCKSGITTKWTCGYITGKNQTVTFDGVNTVYGLTQDSACVEHGDSGGANVSLINGSYAAEGVTSGASLVFGTTCLSKFGLTNVSWYYPMATSIAYYGPKYGLPATLW